MTGTRIILDDDVLAVLREEATRHAVVNVESNLLVPLLDELSDHRARERKYAARIDAVADGTLEDT